jgi:sulfonate transport system substrate-binding protein
MLHLSRFALLLSVALFACGGSGKPEVIRLDYANYNPLSLLLRERGYVEQALAPDGVRVEWVESVGSNKAVELLNSNSADFASTAGAAALIGRANHSPIRAVYVYSKPEWTALVTRPASGIESVTDLKGKKVAATRGTDPFVFLLRALDSVGLSEADIELVPLQHSDGKLALERGDVDAWAGLDPLMASAELEHQARLVFRNPDWNTYGVLDVRQAFAETHPSYVVRVLEAYERARADAVADPNALYAALERKVKLPEPVLRRVLARTNLAESGIGEKQASAIVAAGQVLKKSGVIPADSDIAAVTTELIDGQFAARLKRL